MLDDTSIPPDPTSSTRASDTQRKPRSRRLIGLSVLALLSAAIVGRFIQRVVANDRLVRTTLEAAVPSVTVIHPQAGAANEEIVLPGYTQAYTDTPIYARTSGYLKAWYFDIGARVKKGDLLAEIETPEVDQQLREARANLATARANLKLAAITARRNEELLKTRSVSTQDRDNADGALAADKAIFRSNVANVARLEQLQSYERIYAPFDGVITARNTDIGDLIDADANSPSKELFHLSAIKKLRVYVSVPEVDAPAARPGAQETLTLDEFPGERFHGTLVRTADAIDPESRTLLVEVDVDNPDGRLLPGAYTFVHLSLPAVVQSVTVPSDTLLFRKQGLQVALVRNGRTQLTSVRIGRDYGSKVEIVSGLRPTDEVVVDPSDSIISGTAVRIADASSE
jgi:RND family efflux transporter MFP subunit